jgi:quinol monooxygenase YgiN
MSTNTDRDHNDTNQEPTLSEIVVIARLQAATGRGPELLDLLAELAPQVLRTEPDTLRYALYVESGADPLRVVVIEKYRSRAGADAHNSGVLSEYLPRLLDLLDGAPDVVELHAADLAVSLGDVDAERLSI